MFSPAVDEVWHTTLLFTQLYGELCAQVAGGFLHHGPADRHEVSPSRNGQKSPFAQFRAAYERAYGPRAPIWRIVWRTSTQGEAFEGAGDR